MTSKPRPGAPAETTRRRVDSLHAVRFGAVAADGVEQRGRAEQVGRRRRPRRARGCGAGRRRAGRVGSMSGITAVMPSAGSKSAKGGKVGRSISPGSIRPRPRIASTWASEVPVSVDDALGRSGAAAREQDRRHVLVARLRDGTGRRRSADRARSIVEGRAAEGARAADRDRDADAAPCPAERDARGLGSGNADEGLGLGLRRGSAAGAAARCPGRRAPGWRRP